MVSRIHTYLKSFGINFKLLLNSFRGIPVFLKNYVAIKKQIKKSTDFKIRRIYPCLTDRFETAGEISLQYAYQDLFIAGKIFHRNPRNHVDIGSRIDGLVTHVAAFREIEVFDIRRFAVPMHNIKFKQADLMNQNFNFVNYCDSVSSLHAIEHFGLGRYGDKIDADGHIKGINNITKMLEPKGKFYFSVPIGPQRIEFDAHRVFSVRYLINLFNKTFKIDSFSIINDDNIFYPEVMLEEDKIESNFNCNYGCGIFELTKL
jgi:SAM-dependent methyltransferase